MSSSPSQRGFIVRTFSHLIHAVVAAVGRLDKSLSPAVTFQRLRAHSFTLADSLWLFHFASAAFWITLMQDPAFPSKLAIPILYSIALAIPLTSQFFVPATPVLSWVLTWYSSRFMPSDWRPAISVSLLPTLESVLYGANISDILTRFTHPILDILAWLPYGVVHFTCPAVIAVFLWLFRTKPVLHLWARTFGYMNLAGVLIQLVLPCSAPWYELIYGGLARIDALFGSKTYTTGFTNSPLVFGAFPSLHAGNATLEALFLSHFFPQTTRYIWAYAGVLYWATMYLTHHYLIDVVGLNASAYTKNKYALYDLEDPRAAAGNGYADRSGLMLSAREFDAVSEPSSEDEEVDITYRSPVPGKTTFDAPPAPHAKKGPPGALHHQKGASRGRGHRHTASIASLIRGDERGPEDGWSPVAGVFTIPPGAGNGRGRTD
ncbi:hypothetical protein BJ912DRAFT_1020927 [Pholiota molesta]|nr:hypothetical protein BJ912DRAFT_1020927 [Pholiota molesta]